ncbi:amidohydrolase [Bradyrhizobium sp. 2TAF24]|uniref:amidohydrolase n=1 Tax=Bradyrhizobium sp. 2TAF24 TaxID=3233011 RepID=UPI003F904A37
MHRCRTLRPATAPGRAVTFMTPAVLSFAAMALGLIAGLTCASPSARAEVDVAGVKAAVAVTLAREYPALDALYKDIHAHPELAFQEDKTAAKLAIAMRAIGFDVTEHVGKTGLVALYRNGDGPTIMVRTELDALPMEEKTGLPYASHDKTLWNGRETFVAHSCGHDIHMASWVGAAKALVELKERWHGTLMFIAQPAEEEVTGAKAMLDDGLFTRFGKPDMAFALHDGPGAYDTLAYRTGIGSSSSDMVQITFRGRGGHGAVPQTTIDPVMMASRFVVDVQSVISREKDPTEFGVVSIGAIHGGTAANIIPDNVYLAGTIRAYKPEVRARLFAGIERTAKSVAAMADAPAPDFKITEGTKPVINDAAVVGPAERVLKAAFGDKARQTPAITASEDFSEFVAAGVPSMFFNIGVYPPEQVAAARSSGTPLPANHSPQFAPVPQPTIETGVTAMTLAVLSGFDRGAARK